MVFERGRQLEEEDPSKALMPSRGVQRWPQTGRPLSSHLAISFEVRGVQKTRWSLMGVRRN